MNVFRCIRDFMQSYFGDQPSVIKVLPEPEPHRIYVDDDVVIEAPPGPWTSLTAPVSPGAEASDPEGHKDTTLRTRLYTISDFKGSPGLRVPVSCLGLSVGDYVRRLVIGNYVFLIPDGEDALAGADRVRVGKNGTVGYVYVGFPGAKTGTCAVVQYSNADRVIVVHRNLTVTPQVSGRWYDHTWAEESMWS